MRHVASALLVPALFASSCAASSASRSPADLVVGSPRSDFSVRVEPGHVRGPNTELQRFDDELRGVWRGAIVNARIEKDRVVGVVDTTPLDLHVEPRDDGSLKTLGLVGGTRQEIELTDEILRARIGACGYELPRTEADLPTYRGFRCGGVLATVRLPESWSTLQLSERATYLALVMTAAAD